jgi:hypothetical protein
MNGVKRFSFIAWYAMYAIAAAGISFLLVIKGSPQLHGIILAAVSIIFILIEAVFWRLSESTAGLFETDVLNTRQTTKLEKTFRAVNSMIRRRFEISVVLRLLAAICAGILLKPEVLDSKDSGKLWMIALCGYFVTILAFPTLIVMVRSYSDATEFKRKLAVKESDRKRLDDFHKSLNPAHNSGV